MILVIQLTRKRSTMLLRRRLLSAQISTARPRIKYGVVGRVVALAMLISQASQAQPPSPASAPLPATYPNKPITLIVPYTGGTTADSLARLLGAKLTERWGVATVTDNRAGASGIIGTEAAAKALPNGYTLLFTATAHGTVPALKPKLPFDPIKSFTPVSLLATSANTKIVVIGNSKTGRPIILGEK